MKAVVITEPGNFEISTVDDPSPADGEVVVKVLGSGICGTDLHLVDGLLGTLPLIPGHEFSGEVVAVGSGVRRLRLGDKVAADPNIPCGACAECQRGRVNLCQNYAAIGINRPGALATYVAVLERLCVVLPDGTDTPSAALIEPLSCALHAFDLLNTPLGSHALIYGAGTMGLMMLQLAKRTGLSSVSVVDLNQSKLATAETLGCSAVATSADEFDRAGWDLVIDATGAAPAIQDGLPRVNRSGTFLQFGVADPAAHVDLYPYWIFEKEITIKGAVRPRFSFARAAELFQEGIIDPNVFVSDTLPLHDFGMALDRFASGDSKKILIQP